MLNLEKTYENKASLELMAQKLEDQSKNGTTATVDILSKLAVLYSSVGNNDKAILYLQKIQSIRPDDLDVYYNLSCIYSRQNNATEAISYLQQAVDKGFNKWDLIKKDPDLANIRNTPYVNGLIKNH